MLQLQIRHTLEKLSNDEGGDLFVDDQWIEDAGEMFKDTLRRQLGRQSENFRLRMSNIGRPVCQLQMAKSGAKATRRPYNFIVRMMHGDILECVMEVLLRVAQANITGGKNKVALELAGQTIKGEDDIEIDHKVYDIKSSSPWAFTNKWSKGLKGLQADDSFGYIGQLVGYAEAQGKEPGGWIVVDKSSGEIVVVEADMTKAEKQAVLANMKTTVETVVSDAPFKRCFEAEEDTFRGKPTGLKKVPNGSCGFCDFLTTCWPTAVNKPHPESKAASPPHYWFLEES